jgi:hypothetical protein
MAVVVLLQAYGANPNARNNDGFDTLQHPFAMDRMIGAVVLKCFPDPAKSLDS